MASVHHSAPKIWSPTDVQESGSTSAKVVVAVVKVVAMLYDVISYPVYLLIYQPWAKLKKSRRIKAERIETAGRLKFISNKESSELTTAMSSLKLDTLPKVLDFAFKRYGDRKCLGTREVLAEEDEVQSSGKVFKKYLLGEYNWQSYRDIDDATISFGKGIFDLGMRAKGRVVIFAETRAEWLISAVACLRQGLEVVTIYATLGEEAILHGILETEVTMLISSHDALPKLKAILNQAPLVKNIVYMEDPLKKTSTAGFPANVKLTPFKEVIRRGESSKSSGEPPAPTDIAIMMYTSGSTGVPKGVLLSHSNLVAALLSFVDAVKIKPNDTYLGYLPLAHVFELLAEMLCIVTGVSIGYSSALTMTNMSSKVKKGCKGDATLLKPSILTAVPLILDRIFKTISNRMENSGPLTKEFFRFAINYKLKWMRRGFDTPILNTFVFFKISHMLGGKVRVIITGGAPLSPDTHDFIRATVCCKVTQGYGLTETSACAALMEMSDMTVGRVGAPLRCCEMRLVSWEEGNYRLTDKPFPRGEVVLGGKNIAIGYYKLPDKTKEDFFDEAGTHWFRTGDIGEIHADGVLKIIDRKKDLVKLQIGEYVSLGKVETELKTCTLVDNICVYGDPHQSSVVALVVPVYAELSALASKLGRNGLNITLEQLCKDPLVEKGVLKELQEHGKKSLEKFEIPLAVKLCPEIWTPDSGLVTAAFKLKRKAIQDAFQAEIDQMYSGLKNGA